MKQKKGAGRTALIAKSVLSAFLSIDANSASCYCMYQPKPPKELSRFKKNQ